MSLGKTLLKLGIGIAIAKGINTLGKVSGVNGSVPAGTGRPCSEGQAGGQAGKRDARRARRRFGGLLDAVLGMSGRTTLPEPRARKPELAAALAMRAMLQAMQCDGKLDEAEKRKLMDRIGDATREEAAIVNAELQRPVDVDGLAGLVPNGMEEQIYLVS